MKSAYIAYIGNNQQVRIPDAESQCGRREVSSQKILGVFLSLDDYKSFESKYNALKGHLAVNLLEIPLNPAPGMISRFAKTYHVVVGYDCEIVSCELCERKPWDGYSEEVKFTVDRSVEAKHREGWIVDVYCYALDEEDACKIAFNNWFTELPHDE